MAETVRNTAINAIIIDFLKLFTAITPEDISYKSVASYFVF